MGVGEDHRILVSAEVNGQTRFDDLLLGFAGQLLRSPQPGIALPARRYLAWHQREAFRGPPRAVRYASARVRVPLAADDD